MLRQRKCTTILTNLLINALKYTPDESTISISTRLSEDKTRVRISISDQGPGLKDVDTNNLFVRFYQGNNSRPGTGIGLSYSKYWSNNTEATLEPTTTRISEARELLSGSNFH